MGKHSARVAVQRPIIHCEQLSVAGKSPNRTKCPAGIDPAGNDSASMCAYIPDKEVFVVYQALGKP